MELLTKGPTGDGIPSMGETG